MVRPSNSVSKRYIHICQRPEEESKMADLTEPCTRCDWHLTLDSRFDQTTAAFIGFFKKPTAWWLSNGSQFCTCYASKNITNNHCAWLHEVFVNIWDVNVFVSCIAVSLQIPGLKKNYESCLQLSHGWNLYNGQIGSRAARLWSCCLQPEPPFYVLLILFPRLCQSVHSIRNCNQCRQPCKQHLCTARQGVCPLVSGNMYAEHWEVCNPL